MKKKEEASDELIERLDKIPGIGRHSAERIIAETGINMEQFANADHFASWAGLVPGCNQSAGKIKNSRLRKGNKYLKSTLVEWQDQLLDIKAVITKQSIVKIAARRGGNKAVAAVSHSMILAIYHMIKSGQEFVDLGSEYFNTINAEKILKRNLKSMQNLGYDVVLNPTF